MAACQDVVEGLEKGEVSKEDVKKARSEVRQVCTVTGMSLQTSASVEIDGIRCDEA